MAKTDPAIPLVMAGYAAAGLLQMAFSPRKTYALLVHGKGWYDDEIAERQRRADALARDLQRARERRP